MKKIHDEEKHAHRAHQKRKDKQKIAALLISFAAVVVTLILLSTSGSRTGFLDLGAPGLTEEDLLTFSQLYDDEPLQGGQESPFISKWVGDDTFAFLYVDEYDASRLKYIGVGNKGVFCQESRPGSEFTDFRKWSVPTYAEDQGGQRGDQGYWMTWISPERFTAGSRNVPLGVDYSYASLDIPLCGENIPATEITVSSKKLSQEDIEVFTHLFNHNPLTGGQSQPWISKWMNDNTFIFLQLTTLPDGGKVIRYIGIGTKGKFCASSRPSEDFSAFQRLSAQTYSEGGVAEKGESGYWMMWIAVDNFNLGGRNVHVGIDRDFAKANPPAC